MIEQNRDAQMRSLLINEFDLNPERLIRILNYDGMPITASNIQNQIQNYFKARSIEIPKLNYEFEIK